MHARFVFINRENFVAMFFYGKEFSGFSHSINVGRIFKKLIEQLKFIISRTGIDVTNVVDGNLRLEQVGTPRKIAFI